MKIENTYTSIACNRTTESADWGSNGLIAFGACNAVGILDPKYNGSSAKIVHTYVQHTKRVNTVQWLRSSNGGVETYLLSGADDGLAILWDLADFNAPQHYLLKGHESGVNAVSGIQRTSGAWLLATAAADSTLKLWHFEHEATECFQTIFLNTGFCFTLRLTLAPRSAHILLAHSADDESIMLWSTNATEKQQFSQVHKLTGHEDWVRSLDFINDGDDLLLASASQDNFIRLWRIGARTAAQVHENEFDIFKLYDEKSGEIRVEEKIVELDENVWYAISLESVLYGHEGWVYGVQWHKSEQQPLRLLSASIDKTIVIWEASEEGIWMEKVRVGEVGGNSLGFFGGKFSSDGKSIMGHGYQGAFHIWQQSAENENQWNPAVIVSGHFGEVRDLAWERKGEYVMSVSADQTTRLHAPWAQQGTWHELARPQVHGYDMQALALLTRYKFTSGAEEKIVRSFQASANFIENFRRLAQLTGDTEGDALLESLPKGASVPSLGLSNKAVYKLEEPTNEQKHVKDEYPENYFVPITLDTPPQEGILMQNTLWPEVQKLYGHGYEIYALAASPDGRLLASSCRATNVEHAQIILWNTQTWKQVQKLSSHQLTVTQMCFSPDGNYLLSVSRDRRWSLFARESECNFSLVANTDKTNGVHARIIWSCDWSHDGKYFATSSRDGKVVVWTKSEKPPTDKISLNDWTAVLSLELKNESITAVAFAPNTVNGAYIIALGFESGHIKIYQFTDQWKLLSDLSRDQSHHLTVKRLQFRPNSSQRPSDVLQLASCGEDHMLRIYDVILS